MDFSPYAVGGATRPDSFERLDPRFRQAVWNMLAAAEQEGVPLRITSAYRSPELQAQLWEAALEKYGDPEVADNWVARPGQSRHNAGLAVDFAGADGGLLRDKDSREARWIAENAARFGLDVPMDWEPWQVEMGSGEGTNALANDMDKFRMMNALASAMPKFQAPVLNAFRIERV